MSGNRGVVDLKARSLWMLQFDSGWNFRSQTGLWRSDFALVHVILIDKIPDVAC